MFRWEQIPHNIDILGKRDIKNYSEHYTVNSKSWKPSVKNRYVISEVFFVVIEAYIFQIVDRKPNY
jgi:hypothetical protein